MPPLPKNENAEESTAEQVPLDEGNGGGDFGERDRLIALTIISAVVLLIVLLLFLPISLDIMYTDDFFMTVRFAGIRIFKIEPGKDIKKPKSDAESDKKAEKQAENPFKKAQPRKGL